MRFDVFFPSPQLMPYVKHIIISENEQASQYRVLPDTALVIGFQYRGALSYTDGTLQHKLSDAGITGLRDSSRTFLNTPNIGTVLVVLRENGAARLLKQNLHELFGESVSVEHFFSNSEFNQFKEQLVDAKDDATRISLTETFLISQLSHKPADQMVNAALQHIHQTGGTIRISELAKLLNTSASPLEKRFRQEVGASPKKFATIVRARNVLTAMEHGNERYAEYLSAFYDQAHFIKAFKNLPM
ncbi:helix-turn-helix transcriptional regulator [Mucilaginibacter auburnensis]|uniref:AraC-like DNA-binding protein n=1 Tax=Mucilaginibacter auburnensis TaxID=1457233 RepID=A0A2H9VU08_9SPHI|nr:DUF6597 domain-containing transcriptional factor [Mucilaginibacter auburnensis]PJJ84291.1 AraC-like DNA-binding protein [Mucilaginibacter auburnensis]